MAESLDQCVMQVVKSYKLNSKFQKRYGKTLPKPNGATWKTDGKGRFHDCMANTDQEGVTSEGGYETCFLKPELLQEKTTTIAPTTAAPTTAAPTTAKTTAKPDGRSSETAC